MELSKRFTGVYCNKKNNGDISYYITYRDINNKFKRVKIGDKSKGITEIYCNQKRNEVIHKVRLGEDPLAKKKKKKIITLDDVAQIYFRQSVHNKDNSKTKSKYKTKLKKKFGHIDIDNISSNDILNYQGELINKGLAPATINSDITFLGTLYNIAIEEELFKEISPTKNKKIKKLKVNNQRERYLSTEEIYTLYESIKDEQINMFVMLSLSTGGRIETILHIQQKDIDYINGVITLNDFKNNSTYKGFLNKKNTAVLTQHMLGMTSNTFIIGGKESKYPTRTCQTKLQSILNKLFNQDLDLDDRKNRMVVHSLRHTFASHLAINGTPILTIKKLMNHTDIKMTLRYAKLDPNSGKEFVQNLY
ncbi:MAG: site-specific integrase [Epsilonproteobacteria bacterium]|nr:MAG: site-specific integrase [Campylobacterota bacterium]